MLSKRLHLVLLVGIALCSACGASKPAGSSASGAAEGERANAPAVDPVEAPFLWEIVGGASPSYLLGTVHVGVAALELPDLVWHEFLAADTIIMETDLTTALETGAALVAPTTPAESTEPAATLDVTLGPEAWSRLVEAVGDRVPPDVIKAWPPWVAYAVIVMSGYEHAMDLELLIWAKTLAKKLVFLETSSEQSTVLENSITSETLELALTDVDAARQELRELIDAYRAGSGARLSAATGSPQVQAMLQLGSRNEAWVAVLEPHLQRGGVLIVVGAAHNFGEEGLPAMLSSRGFGVRRLGVGTPATIPLVTTEDCDALARHKTQLNLDDPAARAEIEAAVAQIDPDLPTDDDSLREILLSTMIGDDEFYAECVQLPHWIIECALAAQSVTEQSMCTGREIVRRAAEGK